MEFLLDGQKCLVWGSELLVILLTNYKSMLICNLQDDRNGEKKAQVHLPNQVNGVIKKGKALLVPLEVQKQLETVVPLVNPPCYSGLTNLLNALWVISRNCWPPSLHLTIPLFLKIPAFFHSLTAVCESFSLLQHLSVKPVPTCRGKKRLRDHFTDHQLSHQLRG